MKELLEPVRPVVTCMQCKLAEVSEAATRDVLQEKVFFEFRKTHRKTPVQEAFLIRSEACIFVKKETLVHMFSCEFCENSKNTFFTEYTCEDICPLA